MMPFRSALAQTLVIAAMFFSPVFAQDDDTVDWHNNYKEALDEAKRTGKPIFLEYRCEP
jgi:hypothetical protein